MPIVMTPEQSQLADTAAKFARAHVDNNDARSDSGTYLDASDEKGWDELVRLGLHAVHLPESAGGQGGTLADLAVVVAEFGCALMPGAFLSSAIAGAVALDSRSDAGEVVVAKLCGGSKGAVVGPVGISATSVEGGYRLTGESVPALGVPSAEFLVVGAATDDGVRWFSVPATAVSISAATGVDLTRRIGAVRFDDVPVENSAELIGTDPARVECISTALLAAEAAGMFRWYVDTINAYVKQREQFGRAVGSFQAVAHRLARLFVAKELATAASWDAVRGLEDTSVQACVAAATAAVTSLGEVVAGALEALGLLGGIGFTWEHDLHLYWRRAMSISSLAGPTDAWLVRAGESRILEPRDFSIDTSICDPDFRASVADVLDGITPGETTEWGMPPGPDRDRLAAAGLVVPHLPRPYGLEAGLMEHLVIQEEFDARGIARPQLVIGAWILPTLVARGNDAQRERYVDPTLRGEFIWCQLFSEPDAGSDIASISTRAVKCEGGWRITGQKIWTSVAHLATHGVALVRTDPDRPGYRATGD